MPPRTDGRTGQMIRQQNTMKVSKYAGPLTANAITTINMIQIKSGYIEVLSSIFLADLIQLNLN